MRRPTPLPTPPTPEEPAETSPQPGDIDAARVGGDTGAAEIRQPPDRGAESAVRQAAKARRRALRGEVRRFTSRQRHRRTVWLVAAGAIVLLVLATLAIAYSPVFAVQRIRVLGAVALDAAELEGALGSQLGLPLPLVDDSAVKAALVAYPLIESYTLEARPPNELIVRIVERTPIGVLRSAAGYSVIDAAGVVLSTSSQADAGYPLLTVRGGTDSDAFIAVGRVIRSLPAEIGSLVTEVSASTADDVTLALGATGTTVVWGNANDSALKAVVLRTAMQSRPPEDVQLYDVSSPDAIVIR